MQKAPWCQGRSGLLGIANGLSFTICCLPASSLAGWSDSYFGEFGLLIFCVFWDFWGRLGVLYVYLLLYNIFCDAAESFNQAKLEGENPWSNIGPGCAVGTSGVVYNNQLIFSLWAVH